MDISTTPSLEQLIDGYKNTAEHNDHIFQQLSELTWADPFLSAHRRHIEENKFGFGDAAFHAMWVRLLDRASRRFQTVRALEIGVFKGQVISLWAMIARHLNIDLQISAITPLSGNPMPSSRLATSFRKYFDTDFREQLRNGNFYEQADYLTLITKLFERFKLNIDSVRFYQGLSTDRRVLEEIGNSTFHIVYVDGDHTFRGALHDFRTFGPKVVKGGWLVADDAACQLPGTSFWKGHETVSEAAKILPKLGFRNILNVGHNRIYERVDTNINASEHFLWQSDIKAPSMPLMRPVPLVRRTVRFCRRAVAGGARLLSPGYGKPEADRWERSWKTELIRHVLEIEKGDFIDIGANVGQTLLDFYAADSGARYIGFEPNPASFVSLFTLVQKKKFKCVILPIGISDKTELLNLYSLVREPTDLSASIVSDLRPGERRKRTPIMCCRFDDLHESLGVTSIGLIKIDVEGAELAVLRGMENSLRISRAPILCEILYADGTADIVQYASNVRAILKFLHEINYALFRVQTDKSGKKFFGLVKTVELPVQVWTPEDAHECDYLLIPSEKIDDYGRLIEPSSR